METGPSDFDQTKQEGDIWLDSVAEHLSFEDRRDAYAALRAALHALRDRLPPDQAVHLSTQLPIAIRGLYFEGWQLSPASEDDRCVQDFCGHIGDELPPHFPLDAKNIAKGVFDVLLERLDQTEVARLVDALPEALQALWARTPHAPSRSGSSSTGPRLQGGAPVLRHQNVPT
jgi:uncharacterized protein (DUF2267 family)